MHIYSNTAKRGCNENHLPIADPRPSKVPRINGFPEHCWSISQSSCFQIIDRHSHERDCGAIVVERVFPFSIPVQRFHRDGPCHGSLRKFPHRVDLHFTIISRICQSMNGFANEPSAAPGCQRRFRAISRERQIRGERTGKVARGPLCERGRRASCESP